jgi:hypothetical protein
MISGSLCPRAGLALPRQHLRGPSLSSLTFNIRATIALPAA